MIQNLQREFIHKFYEFVNKFYNIVKKFYELVNFLIEKIFLEIFLFQGFKKSEIKTEISYLIVYITRPVYSKTIMVVCETRVQIGKVVRIFGKII